MEELMQGYDDPLKESIFENDLIKEQTYALVVNKILCHSELNFNLKMRTILIGWIYEVVMKFKLSHETFQIFVSIFDRFLSKHECKRDDIQLIGISSLFLASKINEVYPPELNDLVYVCANAYTAQQIVHMEWAISTSLDFKLNPATYTDFQVRFSHAAMFTQAEHEMCLYIYTHLIMGDTIFTLPLSYVAIGITYTVLSKDRRWTDAMVYYTRCSEERACELATRMSEWYKMEIREHHKSVMEKVKRHFVRRLKALKCKTEFCSEFEFSRPSELNANYFFVEKVLPKKKNLPKPALKTKSVKKQKLKMGLTKIPVMESYPVCEWD
jgi:hypothetical protein